MEGCLQKAAREGSHLADDTLSEGKLARWLGQPAIEELANRLEPHVPAKQLGLLNAQAKILIGMPFLTRREHLARTLKQILPSDFTIAASILIKVLPEPRKLPGYGDWSNAWLLVCSRYFSMYGLGQPETGLAGIREVTRRFTGEFDVRPFFLVDSVATLRTAVDWTGDPCEHVRRLAIESLRPRLPWSYRLTQLERDPAPLLDLCTRVIDDESKYVLRSVANTIADIYKANSDAALRQLTHYLRQPTPMRLWVVRHSLRYPVRKGDSQAVRFLERWERVGSCSE